MVALQIRDVPESVRDRLAARARANGQSLQGFLLALVVREASFARNLELLEEIESWPSDGGPSAEDILAERDAVRAERGEGSGSLSPQSMTVADGSPQRRGGNAA